MTPDLLTLAARVLALARPEESLHTAARRLLGVAVEEGET